MLYSLIRPIAAVALKAYFRKIYFSHRERIPANKPVLLATNHPTAFLEPCLFACFQDRPLHFLVRGDFFEQALYRWLLVNLNMVPIFRRRDGFRSLKQNQTTFEKCYSALAENAMIMILAEGQTILGKRLRPVQRGAARIAFGAIEAHGPLDIHIVPAGATFMDPNDPGNSVVLSVGPAIRILEHWEEYQAHPQETIRKITERLEEAIRTELVHVNDHEDDALIDKLLEFRENEQGRVEAWRIDAGRDLLDVSQAIVHVVNHATKAEKFDLGRLVQSYTEKLNEYKLSDYGVVHHQQHNRWRDIVGMLVYLPWLFIRAINYPPVALGNYIANTHVKSIEFYGPIKLAGYIGGYLIWWILISILSVLLFGVWGLLVLVLMPFSGWLALVFNRWFVNNEAIRKAASASSDLNEDLCNMRKKIMEVLS